MTRSTPATAAPLPDGALLRDTSVPALGAGRVLACTHEEVTARFEGADEPRTFALADHPELVRLQLLPGRPVVVDPDGEFPADGEIAGEIDFGAAGLWTYPVLVAGVASEVVESRLLPAAAAADDALARLLAGHWSPPADFAARDAFTRTVSRWQENAMGTPPFLGARVHPLPHQIHAARRVLCDRTPRYVLADEVGLGKTIEAGLIVQALQSAKPDLRVLVLAPGAMSRQWLCELFLRFGDQIYLHVDAPRLAADDHEELLAAPRVIVSTTALESEPEFAARLAATPWDLVIVDEVHQIPPEHPLYATLTALAARTPGWLALSATPSQRNERGLLGLLALVDPARYSLDDPEAFRARLARHQRLAGRIRASQAAFDDPDLEPAAKRVRVAEPLREALAEDPAVQGLLASLDAQPRADASLEPARALLAYVEEYHALDRRIIRTRRAQVSASGTPMCTRRLDVLGYQAGPGERAVVDHVDDLALPPDATPSQLGLAGIYRQAAATTPLVFLELLERRRRALAAAKGPAPRAFDFLAALHRDPGPAEAEFLRDRVLAETPPFAGEIEWLAEAVARTHEWLIDDPVGCARFRAVESWIKRRLKSTRGGKILVFAQDREEVEAFAHALSESFGPDAIGALHHAVDEGQTAELALRFQQPGGIRVLISDDLGGDGRNFQVAAAVVHLNQPWSVSRLEQRIGRLDRMGRKADRDVVSVAVAGPSRAEAALLALHRNAFKVYTRSVGGLEFLLPSLQPGLLRAACEGPAALEALARPFAAEVEQERTLQAEAAEADQAAAAERLEEAKLFADVLAATDGAADVASVQAWARTLGMQVRRFSEEQYYWRWTWEHLTRIPPGLVTGEPPTEGRLTKRGTFSRYRALGNEALEFFAPGHPVVDALTRDLFASSCGRATAFTYPLGRERRGRPFLLALVRSEEAIDPAVPAGLRYRARARLWMVARVSVVALSVATPGAASVVNDPALRALEDLDPDLPIALEPDTLTAAFEPEALHQAISAGAAAALAGFRAERAEEIEYAVSDLEDDLRPDRDYLRGALARDPDDEDAARELELRDLLVRGVAAEGAVLEALAVVIGR